MRIRRTGTTILLLCVALTGPLAAAPNGPSITSELSVQGRLLALTLHNSSGRTLMQISVDVRLRGVSLETPILPDSFVEGGRLTRYLRLPRDSGADTTVEVCIESRDGLATTPQRRCEQTVLRHLLSDIGIGSASYSSRGIRFQARNRSALPTERFTINVSTRSGGRLVGSARHTLAPLGPGQTREETVPVALWREPADAWLEDCCQVRLVADPADELLELDETNNRIEIQTESIGSGNSAARDAGFDR